MMTMKHAIWIGIVTAATSGACKKTSGGAGGEGGKPNMPPELAAWMPKDATAGWEGAWSTRLSLAMSGRISMAGDPAALEIKGAKAKAFDGTKDHDLGFAIASPCTVNFTRKATLGGMEGTETMTKQYVVKDGKVLIGDGAAGYRKDKTAMVCASSSMDGYYVLSDKGCMQFKDKFGKLESAAAQCAWSNEDGKDVLTLGEGDWKTKVIADGDTLQSEQFTEMTAKSVKTASFDEAKAKVAELVKSK
jgi:hypothetical protein